MNTKCRLALERYGMLQTGDHVVVGLSGGADSCAMLHFLHGLKDEMSLDLRAVHVHHGIRGEEAERDAAFAADFCRALGVPFRLYRRDVPRLARERGMGLEACGRAVRYEIFTQEAEVCGGKIATAHTRSDSVETVLLHLIRGCSPAGLCGIPPVRGNIIRPLILCDREDVEAYCRANGLDYVTDSTNFSTDYARNRIRLSLLPAMRELNPSVNDAISRLSDCAAADEAFWQTYAGNLAAALLEGNPAPLREAENAPAGRALVMLCRSELQVTPEWRHVAGMLHCVRAGEGFVNLPGGCRFSVKGTDVFFEKKADVSGYMRMKDAAVDAVTEGKDWHCPILPGEIIAPGGQKIILRLTEKNSFEKPQKISEKVFKNSLDYDKIKKASFRCRKSGDSFRPYGRGCRKSLKKLLNEEKIPVAARWQLPLIDCGGEIAWMAGFGVAEGFEVTDATVTVLQIESDGFFKTEDDES